MIKTILFDADGVTIKPRHKYFSDRLAEDYGVPKEHIMVFFKKEYAHSSRGNGDIKEALPQYLKEWGIEKTPDQFLEYWFSSENSPNHDMLDIVTQLRKEGVRCILVTDQEKHRAYYILNTMHFNEYFDAAYFSCDLGYKKSEKEFFQTILEKEKLDPAETAYWDDDESNVAVAKETGIQAHIYVSLEDFRKQTTQTPTKRKAAGIFIQNKKVLVLRDQGEDIFMSPGGRIEAGETPEQALVREMEEEASLKLDENDLEFFGEFTHPDALDPAKSRTIRFFTVKRWSGEITPNTNIEEARWVDSEESSKLKIGSIFAEEVIPRLKQMNLIA
jgi:mutator protein MutT/HAD superfamily hydrolase (TIGR01509 family)